MKNFHRGNRGFSGGRDFKRQDFDRRDSSERRSMHRATCGECGNDCEVPFIPTGNRPVFCNKCFEKKRGLEPRRFEERNTGGRYNNYSENKTERGNGNNEGQLKKQLESLNWKLDKILKILTPSSKPVLEEKIVKEDTKGASVKIAKINKKKKETVETVPLS